MPFNAFLRATVMCEAPAGLPGRICHEVAEYVVNAEEVSLVTFLEDAEENFKSRGWKLGPSVGSHTVCKCPQHANC